jgi:hypothetical protein
MLIGIRRPLIGATSWVAINIPSSSPKSSVKAVAVGTI